MTAVAPVGRLESLALISKVKSQKSKFGETKPIETSSSRNKKPRGSTISGQQPRGFGTEWFEKRSMDCVLPDMISLTYRDGSLVAQVSGRIVDFQSSRVTKYEHCAD